MSLVARFRLDYPSFCLDVDLDLPSRGVTALFGHSGSGKTTLLRCIAGLVRAPGGRLAFDGEAWQDAGHFLPPHRRPLGYVFQEASLFPHLSARANIDYGRQRATAPLKSAALDHVIELLGIGALLDRRPDQLSGGERQRIAIARALAVRPRLLLMDEPLAALDHARKQEILPYLDRLRAELDIPILYVSHAPDEVARLADHIVVLEGGRVLAQGPLADTLARVDLPIRLGDDTGVVIEASLAERDENWHLARVEFPGGSLWLPDPGLPPDQRVRVRILARDVGISLTRQAGTSVLNQLPGTITAIADDGDPALTLVQADLGGAAVVARVARRGVAALGLEPGRAVWLEIKAASALG
ncbi:MAG: molybdenum ABC transporter ATP-binding protein [Pseudomonadota bacterium]